MRSRRVMVIGKWSEPSRTDVAQDTDGDRWADMKLMSGEESGWSLGWRVWLLRSAVEGSLRVTKVEESRTLEIAVPRGFVKGENQQSLWAL